ncbi:MAG: UvrD-helicase domain-containing protein [Bacteroidales bacterium]|nr:UvrD-helicase domain-containing protein [Bacteroidales bacterium]
MENEGNKILEGLNEAQKEAVMCLTGPCLIVAGAGSGKTKVLTCKIANILSHGFKPYSVLALTFTNKAAREMKQRIADMVGERSARMIYMGTFHSIFLRFLRQYAALLDFPPGFTIYDKEDSKALVKRCIKELQLDDKIYKPNEISGRISECKNNFITPQEYLNHPELIESDKRTRRPFIQGIYEMYQKRCKEQGVMDFDDILLNTYRLLAHHPEAFAQIKAKFQFILVDEYQDTNYLQYVILRALAQDHQNITVVGDDAQSIYAFRGARIENILNFQKDYPDARVFRLERNYRSTQTIVNAANSVIKKNKGRITKECYSKRDVGQKIELLQAYTEQEEALLVASSIMAQIHQSGARYRDFAVLYRTNAQSRSIEEALRKKNIPYKIYAGHSFYERAEIKRMISYLRLIANPQDDEAFKRTVNYPSRGIGATSMERIIALANENGKCLTDAVMSYTAEQFQIRQGLLDKVRDFVLKMETLRSKVQTVDAYQLAVEMDSLFGITAALKADTSLDGQTILENVLEFLDSIKTFVDEGVEEFKQYDDNGEYGPDVVTLDLFLQNIALVADSDSAQESSETSHPAAKEDKEDDRVSLMTVHSSKGLEFPYVYITGLEENLFPSGGPSGSAEKEIEEERRLFYVAVTRAENAVRLSFSRARFRWGNYENNLPSRFIREIDSQYILNPLDEGTQTHSTAGFGGLGWTGFPRTERRTIPKPSYQAPQRPQFTPSTSLRPKNENFVADAPTRMREGMRVEHERFGMGKIISLSGNAGDLKAIVDFDDHGRKTLLLKFAKMRIVQ